MTEVPNCGRMKLEEVEGTIIKCYVPLCPLGRTLRDGKAGREDGKIMICPYFQFGANAMSQNATKCSDCPEYLDGGIVKV